MVIPHRTKGALLIVGGYSVALLFDLVDLNHTERLDFYEWDGLFDGYPGTWDGLMTLANYVYYYCEHVSLMMIFYGAYLMNEPKMWVSMFWLEFLDLVDYALIYNYTWFTVFGVPIDFNLFKFVGVLYSAYRYGGFK